MKECHDVYSSDGTKFITRTHKATSGLFFFKAEVLQKQDSEATISVLKLNAHDLWHQRLGHANLWVIKALPAHIIGGPATGVASPPTGLCDGCKKGKSKRLPFPPLKSRAETTLALFHSDLDEMSAASIDGYKWTATYLDDHTHYGMMFFLKHKDEQFDAFKTYKAWAECQTGWKLETIHTDRGSEFLSKEQKRYLQECGIEHQTSMSYSPQQNGRAEHFQQTIINKVESMRHAAGLSDGFWKHAVSRAVHIYNVTPISKAEFLTPKEMWSGSKPDISHLRILGCAAYIHILKGKRQKFDPKSREMIFVGYENLSKGWQFWDAKNRHIKISRDVKFDESRFPLCKDLDQRNPSAVEKRRSISPSQRSESTDNSHNQLIPGAMSDSNGEYPSAPVPPKIKTPPSSSGSSTSTSHRGRSPHPRSDSDDISPDEDENVRPPFHKLRRRGTRGSPPPPIASLSRIYPQIGSPPKLEPVGDIRYKTTSGGETPEPRSPSPDLLNISNMLIYAFQEEPQMLKQALKTADHEKWLAASKEEYDNLIEMGTWKLVSLPRDKRPIKCRWRYVIKADGRFKGRLVAKGFTQVQGIDYEETFSPVLRYELIRYILAHAALLDWEIEAMDVKTAFLYGELKEEIYMEQPEGFVVKGQEKKVCKLVKSIYGLKQAGPVWYELMADTLRRKLGFEQIHSDARVYILRR